MATQVFKTPEDFDGSVELVGAGVAGPNGKGGIVVEEAAQIMGELQNEDGEALKGKALTEAAKDYAEGREDLVVVSLSDQKVEQLGEEMGSAPDRPPAAEVAEQEYKDTYGDEETPDLEAEAKESDTAVPTDVGDEAADSGQEG